MSASFDWNNCARAVVGVLTGGLLAVVMNSTDGVQTTDDDRAMRNVALRDRIRYFTALVGVLAAALATMAISKGKLVVGTLQG